MKLSSAAVALLVCLLAPGNAQDTAGGADGVVEDENYPNENFHRELFFACSGSKDFCVWAGKCVNHST